MPSEVDLREALAHGVASVYPDVDAELDRVLTRATVRTRTRRATYAAGLAAAVTLVLLLAGQDWLPRADAPPPATPVPVRDLPSGVGRYASPADLEPGRWNVDFLPDRWPHRVEADVTVPAGWGQDDRFALATGPAGGPATRRVDFISGRDAGLTWCARAALAPEPTALDVARTLGSVTAMSATHAPEPVTVGGHRGYFVELRDLPGRQKSLCPAHDHDTSLYTVPGVLEECPGYTTLAWVLDVDGQLASVYASYGPAVSDDQVDELRQMVESTTITVR